MERQYGCFNLIEYMQSTDASSPLDTQVKLQLCFSTFIMFITQNPCCHSKHANPFHITFVVRSVSQPDTLTGLRIVNKNTVYSGYRLMSNLLPDGGAGMEFDIKPVGVYYRDDCVVFLQSLEVQSQSLLLHF